MMITEFTGVDKRPEKILPEFPARPGGHSVMVFPRRLTLSDIRITGKGSTDPDVPVDADNMVIKMRTERWEEKENYTVGF